MYNHMEREFTILQKLNGHPNIVQVFEYFPEPLSCRGYLTLEKIDGYHILDHVVENGPFAENNAKPIFAKILDAVKFMHSKNVVHRDFNPTNVFLTTSGEVKILDFNVSKLVELESDFSPDPKSKFKISLQTKTGTPIYTAPELYVSIRYSEAIDMWGAGIILYVLLSAERPFYDLE